MVGPQADLQQAISHPRPDRTYSTPSWCEPDRRPSAGACGPRSERDQGGQVAFADDAQGAVTVSQGEVGQVGVAGLGDTQGVEREQASERMVVAARQPRLDEEGSELRAVETQPRGFLRHLRPANVDGGRVL